MDQDAYAGNPVAAAWAEVNEAKTLHRKPVFQQRELLATDRDR